MSCQSLSSDAVIAGQNAAQGQCGLFLPYTPTIDGVEFTVPPTELASQGAFSNPVPLLLGTNENEGVTFNTLALNATQADVAAAVQAMFGADAAPTILGAYPVGSVARWVGGLVWGRGGGGGNTA